MNAARELESYTVEDIYALPDGMRAELIDGQIYYMALPSTRHQRFLNFINTEINMCIRKNHGKCEVFPAPFAVFLNKDNINYVEPDISVICDASKLDEKGCHGAPDWIVEIVSPGNKTMDYFTKLFLYRAAKVREYWIVDSAKQMTAVYRFEEGIMEEYSFGEDIPVGIFDGFSIKIG